MRAIVEASETRELAEDEFDGAWLLLSDEDFAEMKAILREAEEEDEEGKGWRTQPRHPGGSRLGGQWVGRGGDVGFVPLSGVRNLLPRQRLQDAGEEYIEARWRDLPIGVHTRLGPQRVDVDDTFGAVTPREAGEHRAAGWNRDDPEIMAAVRNAQPVITTVDDDLRAADGGDTAYYLAAPGGGRLSYINMNRGDGSTPEERAAIWRHEYGHKLDYDHPSGMPYSTHNLSTYRNDVESLKHPTAAQKAAFERDQDAVYAGEKHEMRGIADRHLKKHGVDFDTFAREIDIDPETTHMQRSIARKAVEYDHGMRQRNPELLASAFNTKTMFQDAVGSLTGNIHGDGHTDEYYRDRLGSNPVAVKIRGGGKVRTVKLGHGNAKETFANYVAIRGGGERLQLAALKRLAPETTERFDAYIASLARSASGGTGGNGGNAGGSAKGGEPRLSGSLRGRPGDRPDGRAAGAGRDRAGAVHGPAAQEGAQAAVRGVERKQDDEDLDPLAEEIAEAVDDTIMIDLTEELIAETVQDFGQRVLDELRIEVSFDITNPVTHDFLEQWGARRIKQLVGTTTRDALAKTLTEGFELGESTQDLMKRIRHTFEVATEARAKMIAETEIGNASNFGNHQAMVQAEIDYKQWVATRDAHTRDAHRALDGQIRPMDEPYVVPRGEHAGRKAQHPSGFGVGSLDIYCRCFSAPYIPGEDGPLPDDLKVTVEKAADAADMSADRAARLETKWRAYDTVRRSFEERMEKRLTRAFQAQRRAVLTRLRARRG